MVSDRRLSMSHETIANLLIIRANHLAWSYVERMGIIEAAVTSFMSTRRKLKPSTSTNSRGVAVKTVSHGDGLDEPPTEVVVFDVESNAVSKHQIATATTSTVTQAHIPKTQNLMTKTSVQMSGNSSSFG